MSKTISITIPDQLEAELQKEADDIEISRSRHIGNILLQRQSNNLPVNNCGNNSNKHCTKYDMTCTVNQGNAKTCEGYIPDSTSGE